MRADGRLCRGIVGSDLATNEIQSVHRHDYHYRLRPVGWTIGRSIENENATFTFDRIFSRTTAK